MWSKCIVSYFFWSLKLYCGYKYTRHCMINRIWDQKQLWLQVNGHAWFHLQGHRWAVRNVEGASVSSGILTHSTPTHDRWISALDRSATLVSLTVSWFININGHVTIHVGNWLWFDIQCRELWTVILLAKIYIEIGNADLVWQSVEINM